MPICERDLWRLQFFESVACPQDVNVPTDDLDSFEWFPKFRWVYDKLQIARSQGLACGTPDVAPSAFPVFAKPNVNLRGMGLNSGIVRTQSELDALPPGHMWMQMLTGEHISTDLAIVRGEVKWHCNALGQPWHQGMFTHWVIENSQRHELNQYLANWIATNLPEYTGMLNVETIGGKMIEVHLRFADQWCDLYGKAWCEALVQLYAKGTWTVKREVLQQGYSVPLFAKHGLVPPHPAETLQQRIRSTPGVSSLQITYFPSKEGAAHPMPPGGFRLGIINCWDLAVGHAARNMLASGFPGVEVMIP